MVKTLVLLCLSTLFVGLAVAPVVNARIDPQTAAGIWLFDENDGEIVNDLSGNENHGTIENAEWTEGVVDSGLSLNGVNARVVVPDADSLDLEEAWSITAWIFVNKSDVNYGHIIGKRNDGLSDANYAFRTSATGTGWETYFWRGGWQGIWGQGAVQKDVWLYMTAVYDGEGLVTIYENGISIGSGNIGAPPPAGTAELHIGGWQNNTSELLDGMLDEVALFSVALTEEDIRDLMENGLQAALGIAPVESVGKLPLTWGSVKTHRR